MKRTIHLQFILLLFTITTSLCKAQITTFGYLPPLEFGSKTEQEIRDDVTKPIPNGFGEYYTQDIRFSIHNDSTGNKWLDFIDHTWIIHCLFNSYGHSWFQTYSTLDTSSLRELMMGLTQMNLIKIGAYRWKFYWGDKIGETIFEIDYNAPYYTCYIWDWNSSWGDNPPKFDINSGKKL